MSNVPGLPGAFDREFEYISIRGLNDALEAVDPSIFDKLKVRVLNDLCRQSRTAASKQIRSQYDVNIDFLRHRLVAVQAKTSSGHIAVRGLGKNVNAVLFKSTKQTSEGVSVRYKTSEPATLVRHGFIRKVFANGPESAYRRTWWDVGRQHPAGSGKTRPWGKLPFKYRAPVRNILGPGAAIMLQFGPGVFGAVGAKIDEKADEVVRRHWKYLAEKAGVAGPPDIFDPPDEP